MGVKCAHCGEANDGWVPEDRLQRVAEQRREAQSKITDLEDTITQLQTKVSEAETSAAGTAALTEQLEALKAEKAGWETERAVLGAGISDPEGLQVARALWGMVPEDKRPEGGVAEWLKSDAAPKAVKTYMPAPTEGDGQGGEGGAGDGGAGAGQGAGGEGGGKLPDSNRGAVGAPSGRKPKFTAAQIEAMSPEEYAANREQILADS